MAPTIQLDGAVEVVRVPGLVRRLGTATVDVPAGTRGVAVMREKENGRTVRWLVEFSSPESDDRVLLWIASQALKAVP